jgi:CelD/BcsL family acetyltransferase involved in cellulose biosynthesis
MTQPLSDKYHAWPFTSSGPTGHVSGTTAPRAYVLNNANQFARLIDPWRQLMADAAEPAIAASPNWLLPMYRHTSPEKRNACTIAVLGSSPDGLAGIVPLQFQPNRWLLPLPCLATWSNEFCFSGLPLLTGADPVGSLQVAAETARQAFSAKAMLFEKVPADGAFMAALHGLSERYGQPLAIIDSFERAALKTGPDFETWFNDSFKRKKRKELRRLRSRLSEAGELESVTLSPSDDLLVWIDEFLALENAGWKGRAGTALACSDHMANFLKAALPMLRSDNELMFWKLTLDGKPLAMLFAMHNADQAWLGKIAFNEDYARFSPGVLLILDATKDLLSRDGLRLIDSSAVPDHPMINHIWRDRAAMNDVLIATPGTSSATFQLIRYAELARRSARTQAKRTYHRYFKGKAK